jgi:hypothetical protein
VLRDLPLGERLDVGAGQLHHADRLALAQERHAEKGASATTITMAARVAAPENVPEPSSIASPNLLVASSHSARA